MVGPQDVLHGWYDAPYILRGLLPLQVLEGCRELQQAVSVRHLRVFSAHMHLSNQPTHTPQLACE
jgi:hypothetical protein